jgi:MFS family permease
LAHQVVYNEAMEYLAVLRQRDFAKLWMAQILTQVGQNLLNFSLIILTFDAAAHSRFANLSVALLVLAFGLPAVVFASTAGTLVDFWDRRLILVIANSLRAALVLLYLLIQGHLWLILLLTLVVSTILQFFIPAETATIPRVVPEKLLLPANSLFIFSLYGAFIIGYSASGPVIQLFGSRAPYVIVAVFMAVAAVLTALLPPQPVNRPASAIPRRLHLVQDFRENWHLVTARRTRFFSILQLTITQGLVSILITLAPALSLALLHIPLQDASHVIILPVGVGMVLGVLLVNVVTRKQAKATVIQAGLIIAGVTLTLLGLSAHLYQFYQHNTLIPVASIAFIIGILMLILGLINAMISAAAQTMLQENTTDANRGKVFASLNMMINLAATFPILITGLLASILSVTKVITLIGLGLTTYAILMALRYRPHHLAAEQQKGAS